MTIIESMRVVDNQRTLKIIMQNPRVIIILLHLSKVGGVIITLPGEWLEVVARTPTGRERMSALISFLRFCGILLALTSVRSQGMVCTNAKRG